MKKKLTLNEAIELGFRQVTDGVIEKTDYVLTESLKFEMLGKNDFAIGELARDSETIVIRQVIKNPLVDENQRIDTTSKISEKVNKQKEAA